MQEHSCWEVERELVFQSEVKVTGLDQGQYKSSTNNYNRLEDPDIISLGELMGIMWLEN